MIRSEQLKKLSWEHHDALKFARNVGRGLSLNADLTQVRSYAVNIAENFLEPHFKLEENSLISRLNETQQRNESVVEVLRQHREFAQLKLQLQQAETPELRPLLDRFSVLLKVHVKLEEGAFFPFIEQTLSIEELQLAEREIDAGHIVNCSNWPDPFWKSRS
ncbi:MAG: hemerythrin domain-containing protein [Chromatiaceae bacterium]|nr:hemerythrin domain-containing protein [Chromatiaceae bacterium]MCP5441520.1 hemerythrin domain-containing protein [Chromatiaceae bacterium]